MSFKTSLRHGAIGEMLFHKAHPGLSKSPTLKTDFINEAGEGVELKADLYPMEKTGNFFFERYSDAEKQSPGGPWQSLQNGTKHFIYFFVSNLTYFQFETEKLVAALEPLIATIPPTSVPNATYTTLGYRVPREQLADIYKEIRLDVAISNNKETT